MHFLQLSYKDVKAAVNCSTAVVLMTPNQDVCEAVPVQAEAHQPLHHFSKQEEVGRKEF